MFSEKALFDTQVDVAKASTTSTIAHLADVYRKGTSAFPTSWMFATVASLVGFVIHGLVVSQVIRPTTGYPTVDAGLADVVKIGTVLTVSQAINTAMTGQMEFSSGWMTSTAMTLGAYFAFHTAVAPYVPQVQGRQALVMDLAKAAFTSMAVQYLSGRAIDREYLMSLGGTLLGLTVFHEVVYPRVFA